MKEWNVTTFMTYILIFIIAILAIVYQAARLGNNFSDGSSNNNGSNSSNTNNSITEAGSFTELESLAETATQRYVNRYYPNLSQGDNFIIRVNSLITNGYIGKLRKGSIKCDGYTSVYNDGTKVTYDAFLDCGKEYITIGYTERFDERY